MRRQPVLGCACGNLCRFDLCAEQPVLWLLVLRATCAHNIYALAICARLRLWQPGLGINPDTRKQRQG